MNWWTVEYGLIGDIKCPQIYGAGLLSSVSESQNCLSKEVKKIPFSLDCINTSYDITEPQPQLFVTPNFEKLSEVLDEIVSLLDAAKMNLESAGDAFSFTLSSGFDGFNTPETFVHFNRGLKARVSVLRDDWSAAQTALTSVEAWMNGADSDAGVYHVFSTGANDVDNQMFEDPNAATLKLMVHPSFLTDAEDGDNRVSNNVLERAETVTYDGLSTNLAPTLYGSSYDPVPMMRAVELQLLQAEVHIGNGDYSSAESIMNAIRTSAGVAEYTGTDASNAVDRVLHEKRYSLFLEGHRIVDMRHYDKTSELPLDRTDSDPSDTVVTFPIPETEIPG